MIKAFAMKSHFFCILILSSFFSILLGKEWTTQITTEEGRYSLGGPLLKDEKNLVGKWKGGNDDGDKWEIFRRANHVYSIQVSWMDDGKEQTFTGHGLWAVRKGEFIYVDILDTECETEPEWPVEVENRIPTVEIEVCMEKLKSSQKQRIVTNNEESGDSVETKVDKFEMSWMKRFNNLNNIEDAQLYDDIQLACITDLSGVFEFFTDSSFPIDKKMAGKWKTTDNDPDDDSNWSSEWILRADGTSTSEFEDEEDSTTTLTHGLWSLRNGKFYGIDLIEGNEKLSFNDSFLWSEKIVKSGPNEFATQWVDEERKILFLPLVITVTDKRVKKFESEKLEKAFKNKSLGLPYLKKMLN